MTVLDATDASLIVPLRSGMTMNFACGEHEAVIWLGVSGSLSLRHFPAAHTFAANDDALAILVLRAGGRLRVVSRYCFFGTLTGAKRTHSHEHRARAVAARTARARPFVRDSWSQRRSLRRPS